MLDSTCSDVRRARSTPQVGSASRRFVGAGALVLALALVALLAAPAGAVTDAAPGPGALAAVTCTSADSCIAVGSIGNTGSTTTLAESWNGTAWTVLTPANPAGGSDDLLEAVACSSPDDCLAVGAYNNGHGNAVLAELWDGSTWSIETVPLPANSYPGGVYGNLDSVSCNSGTACTAVGDYPTAANANTVLAEGWNGTAFAPETVPTGAATESTLDAVSCAPAPSADCEAVGWFLTSGREIAKTLVVQWNGTKWTLQHTVTPKGASGGSYPFSVSCTSPDACTSVGEGDALTTGAATGWAQGWNGTTWSNQTTPKPKTTTVSILAAVSCSASSSFACEAVGYDNLGSLAEGWNGTKWAIQRTPAPKGSTAGALSGVWCSSLPGSCDAVGYDTNASSVLVPLVEYWNGTKWSLQKTPNLPS